jgi:hypothetical protein
MLAKSTWLNSSCKVKRVKGLHSPADFVHIDVQLDLEIRKFFEFIEVVKKYA